MAYVYVLKIVGREFPWATGWCREPEKYLAKIREKHGDACQFEVLFGYTTKDAVKIANFLQKRRKVEINYYMKQGRKQIKAWFDSLVGYLPMVDGIYIDEAYRIQVNKSGVSLPDKPL